MKMNGEATQLRLVPVSLLEPRLRLTAAAGVFSSVPTAAE